MPGTLHILTQLIQGCGDNNTIVISFYARGNRGREHLSNLSTVTRMWSDTGEAKRPSEMKLDVTFWRSRAACAPAFSLEGENRKMFLLGWSVTCRRAIREVGGGSQWHLSLLQKPVTPKSLLIWAAPFSIAEAFGGWVCKHVHTCSVCWCLKMRREKAARRRRSRKPLLGSGGRMLS